MSLVGPVIWAIRLTILAITLVTWAAVGFIFWIPFLARSTAIFSAMIVYVTLVEADAKVLGSQLDRAIVFYVKGFRNIIDAVYSPSDPNVIGTSGIRLWIGRFLLETLWTIVFWVGMLLPFGYLSFVVGWVEGIATRLK